MTSSSDLPVSASIAASDKPRDAEASANAGAAAASHRGVQNPFQALVAITALCAVASVSIVALAFCLTQTISATGLWAVAAMSAAPAAMGFGIAYLLMKR
ncbi:hypothetical protein [Actomonas aquatica]|uniref:Uncharacterized protein n=1 Tax=Actomonas aquatica TaxID=2866162 RepID=A0ABZ1C686_9BACT|nr:hypothetical protein [Opitutus sp. WL0086]WRQ87239.1 hypothetical protein K1X11_020695 [Opitutus sp. WL0086]